MKKTTYLDIISDMFGQCSKVLDDLIANSDMLTNITNIKVLDDDDASYSFTIPWTRKDIAKTGCIQVIIKNIVIGLFTDLGLLLT